MRKKIKIALGAITMLLAEAGRQRMKKSKDQLDDMAWLGAVRDVHFPLNPTQPMITRDLVVTEGGPTPRPTNPHPEQHPYYELGINLEGHLITHIGAEKIRRAPGSLMMVGPGVPHCAFHLDYPNRAIVVHFLPILLLEMGPEGDGARLLSRFTAARKINERIFDVPKSLLPAITRLFDEMARETREKRSYWELRLRAHLVEILTQICRWEEDSGKATKLKTAEPNWVQMEKSLRFIHENYGRDLYMEEIAKAAGLSVAGLQSLFRQAYGISCVHYLLTYRISQAKGLLCSPGARVNEVAQAVGLGRLSHFNTAFRESTGMSPTEFVKKQAGKPKSA